MNGMMATLKVKPDKMWRQVDGSFVLATELAETLVTDAKLSFRESYKVAADLVNLTISRGCNIEYFIHHRCRKLDRKALQEESSYPSKFS